MKYIALLILISIFSLSCQEETVTEYIEKPAAWTQHSEIEHIEKYMLNGSVLNDELHLIGRNIFTRIDTSNQAISSIWAGYDYQNIKIPMSDILMLTTENNNKTGYMEFVYIPGLIEDGYPKANIRVRLADIDTSFVKFDYFNAIQNITFGAYNNKNQLLIPYEGSADHFSFMLISFDIDDSPNLDSSSDERYINIKDSKIVNIPKVRQFSTSQFIVYATGQDFIIANNVLTAKIYSNGDYRINNTPDFRPVRFFELKGTLYAVNYVSNIYTSVDSGETWRATYETEQPAETFMYTVIDNRVVLSKRSSILKLVFNEEGFTTVELENDALQGNYITSINVLNNKVYISTMSGLFYRNLSDFFTPKPIE